MHFKFKYIYLILELFFFILWRKNIKIGIIGLSHNCNIGNNLLKYAISVKLF